MHFHRMKNIQSLLLVGLAFGLASSTQAASFLFTESGDGDLSNTPASPTILGDHPSTVGFSIGSNFVRGATVTGDPDIFSFTVGVGYQLSAIHLTSYSSTDTRGFIAVQSGSIWNNGVGSGGNFNRATILGYTHFGTHAAAAQPGTDVLDNLGASSAGGAIGFTGVLGAGTYTFLVQQTGAAVVNYEFDLKLTPVPEPGEYALVAGALLGGFAAWRRRRV
jgi:hypothetical protein